VFNAVCTKGDVEYWATDELEMKQAKGEKDGPYQELFLNQLFGFCQATSKPSVILLLRSGSRTVRAGSCYSRRLPRSKCRVKTYETLKGKDSNKHV
jgi:hypothetical protein